MSIYISNRRIHEQVEAEVVGLLSLAGLRVESRDEPIIGSWFRRIRAGIARAARSPLARESALVAAHMADSRYRLAQDAAITATLMQNLGPLIASLDKTKDAVIRVGALLLVKVDWQVTVYQLTAAQQFLLDTQPELAMSPGTIAGVLSAQPVQVGAGRTATNRRARIW